MAAKDTVAKAVTAEPKPMTSGPLTAIPKPSFGKDTVPYDKYSHPTALQEALPIKPGFDDSIYQWRYFRVDELPQLDGSMRCGYWIPVHISLDYLDYNMANDVFVGNDDPGCPWDADGYISKGGFVKTGNGRECREKYLCVRPMQVYVAEQALKAEMSRAAANATSPAHMAQLAKNNEGSRLSGLNIPNPADPSNPHVQVLPSDKVAGPPPTGWQQLGGA